jgi:putative acetyltransferase
MSLEITVRASEVDDAEDLLEIVESGNVVYHTLQEPYMMRESVRNRLENVGDNLRLLAAEVNERVVGQLGLHLNDGRRAHVASLGMMIHADFQGQGVGSALLEAAIDLAENWLQITRIELEVYTDNEAGQALYRKFGFEIEGTLREYAFRDGKYADSYLMARIRDETPA